MDSPAAICVIRDKKQAQSLLQGARTQFLNMLQTPESASSLAQKLKLPRQKVNYHLRALEEAGLVHLVEERRARNCTERVLQATALQYVISPEILEDLADQPTSDQNRFSSAYLIQLAAKTLRELGALRQQAHAVNKPIATMSMDGNIRFASAEARTAFATELAEMLGQLAAKYHKPSAPDGRDYNIMFGAYPKPQPNTSKEDSHD